MAKGATVIRDAWLAFWQPWRVAFVAGAITGTSTMYVTDHPDTSMRSVVGVLVALGVLPWIALLTSSRGAGRDEVRYSGPGRGVQIVHTEGLPEGYAPPSGAAPRHSSKEGDSA